MENNNVNIDSKEKKRITIKFIIIMIAFFCLGGLIGFVLSLFRKNLSTLFGNNIISTDKIIEIISYSSMFLIIIDFITLLLTSLILISKSKKLIAIWDEEDDDTYIKIDKTLGKALNFSNICFVLNSTLFGLACYNLINSNISSYIFIVIIFYLLTIFTTTFFQGKIVNITKELNPEKEGNVLDMNFQKSWFNSCDEAERHIMYEGAFKSFKFMGNVYAFILIVLSCIGMFFKIGILPIIIVGILYLMQVISYTINVQRLENKHNSK